MLKKSFFIVILTLTSMLTLSSFVAAQTAPASGRVELQKADGTKTPVQGALVEIYRVDIKGTLPSAKTDKRGNFNFVALPLGGRFVLSVSAPGAKPGYYPNVKAGDDKIVVTLQEGDGSRWTEEQVREAAASIAPTTGSQPSAEAIAAAKKQQAEQEQKMKEIAAKNEEVKNKNALIQKSLEEGNTAFKAKDFDTAVARYTDGVNADPTFVGSVPVLAANKAIALRERAIATYNQSIKSTDASAKLDGMNRAKKDFADAIASLVQAWSVVKAATPAETAEANFAANKSRVLQTAIGVSEFMVKTEQVSPESIESAKALVDEYVAVETDAAKKAAAKLVIADLYRVAADSEKAIAGYREVLATNPDNVDALAGLGLSLVNLGYIKNDKALLQDGANQLQRFISTAPDTHRYKQDATLLIESLKADQNVTPQKGNNPGRRRP